jgi:diguanylate cyclase (GGDEF)-like protein/PAS domain S-box-containing protein
MRNRRNSRQGGVFARYKRVLIPPVAFLVGAILLSSFSLLQKHWLGLTNIFAPRGFVLPVLFGGGCGLVLSLLHVNLMSVSERSIQSQENLQDFLDNASDLIQSVDLDGHLTYVNAAWRNALKYTDEDFKSLTVFDIIHPEERERCRQEFEKILGGDANPNIETVFIAKDGSKVFVSGNVNCRFENGLPVSTRGIFRDMTGLRKARETEWLVTKVFEFSLEAIMIIDSRGRILKVNPAFTLITGYSAGDVAGRFVYEFLKPNNFKSDQNQPALQAMARGTNWQGEIQARRKNGELFLMGLSISRIYSEGGSYTLVAIFNDITERKQNEQRLEHLATHDHLTNLPNRVLLQERLDGEICRARKQATMVAVLFIDLDGFKEVNDLYGHDLGDRLMQTVAARIRNSVRRSDLVARVGGDEFAIIAGDIPDVSAATLVAEKILASASRPYRIDQNYITVTLSIGISFYPDCRDPRSMLIRADKAMYQAKQDGKNTYRVFRTGSERLNKQPGSV